MPGYMGAVLTLVCIPCSFGSGRFSTLFTASWIFLMSHPASHSLVWMKTLGSRAFKMPSHSTLNLCHSQFFQLPFVQGTFLIP